MSKIEEASKSSKANVSWGKDLLIIKLGEIQLSPKNYLIDTRTTGLQVHILLSEWEGPERSY